MIDNAAFHPSFIRYGERNVDIIVIVPIMGRIKWLATPISIPPFATIKDISPPREDERLVPVWNAIFLLKPWDLALRNTIINLDKDVIPIKTSDGMINTGIRLMSISAPTDTKNRATNISLIGVVRMLVTAWDFDSAIKTPAKKAPTATDIPNRFEIYANPNARPKTATTKTSLWLVFATKSTNRGIVFEPIIKTAAIKAIVKPIGIKTSVIDTVPDILVDCKMANIDNIYR